MNISMIVYFVGWVLKIEALMMMMPVVTALLYGEREGLHFLIMAAVCLLLGQGATYRKPANTMFFAKEGFMAVALSWIVLSFFGAIPFLTTGEIPLFEDAMFEAVSGFTATGASILTAAEELPYCMVMWISFAHWIGGMGILVFLLSILPLTNGHHMHIMRAESPGPTVGKLVPHVKVTAKILYLIYLLMTLLQIILLLVGGMSLFDAITISLSTAGTGGFITKSNSMAFYDSYYLQAVISIFMVLFGINFNIYYLLLIKKPKDALQSEELRAYLGLILVASFIIALNIHDYFNSFFKSFHHAFFQVSSIITTTGYSTHNFDLWPELSKMILLVLMFFGACAGSTSGGMKISRVLIIIKSVKKELGALIHPKRVKVLKLEKKPLETHVIQSVNAFLIAYFVLFVLSLLIISIDDFDFSTNFTAIVSTLSNIGSGFSHIGPLNNFSDYSAISKFVLMFNMLAGRLEIFPMLLLFSPSAWKSK